MGCGNSKKVVDVEPKVETLQEKKVRKPVTDNFPRTQPPTSRKREAFNRDDLREAENRAYSVPTEATDNYELLISHLTNGATYDLEKVWSVYVWLSTVNFDVADLSASDEAHNGSPRKDIERIQKGELDLPTFFSKLCRKVEVPCIVVDGIAKNGSYEVGMSENQLSALRSRWNAVYLAESWRLVNVVEGISSANAMMIEYWFMTDPEEFSTICHPDDHKWQLLIQPYSRKQFANLPFCKPEFFRLKLKIIEPTFGRVKVPNGKVSVELAAPKSFASRIVLYHRLQGKTLLKPKNISLREVVPKIDISQDVDAEDLENVEKVKSETTESIHFPENLDKYVFMSRRETHVFFDIILPVAGSYIFSVHCAIMDKDMPGSDFPVVCQYKMLCNEPCDVIEPLPDTPLIGWGPSFECSRYGLRPLSHRSGHIYLIPNETIHIQFKVNKELDFKVSLLHHKISSEELKNLVSHHVNDHVLTIHASIPQEGRYALEIFAKQADELEYKNICNYLLIYDKSNPNLEKYPKRMLRDRLERAISKGTRATLEMALENFALHLVPDHGEVGRANDKLEFFSYRQALSDAIKRRNITVLENIIQKARSSKYSVELEEDIKKAEDYLNRLRRLHGFIHPIKKMEMSTILEIRSYTRPQIVIKDILTATYMLLGEKEEYLQSWRYIQSLLAQSGKEGLQKRIESLDVDRVQRDSIHVADGLLEHHDLKDAREASVGAAAFFQWAKHICNEKKDHTTTDDDKHNIEKGRKMNGIQNLHKPNISKSLPRKSKVIPKTKPCDKPKVEGS